MVSHTGIDPRLRRESTVGLLTSSRQGLDPNASGGAIILAASQPIRQPQAVHSRTPISLGFLGRFRRLRLGGGGESGGGWGGRLSLSNKSLPQPCAQTSVNAEVGHLHTASTPAG